MRALTTMAAVIAAFTGLAVIYSRAPQAQPAPPGAVPSATADSNPDAGRHAVASLSDTVTITIRSSPGSHVRWGGKSLGNTPVVLERPRESGPLDLTLTAGGYLPLHIRAYTFSDDTVNARLVPYSRRSSVFGFPAALDAGVPAPPSDGVAPSAPVPSTEASPPFAP